jgi:NRPS condensation-like uncharacterized protein
MRRAPLDRLDEACLNLGSADEPWTVHLEARAEGRIDEVRLRTAIRSAMATHPIARARIEPWKWNALRYWWLIPDEPLQAPLIVVSCETSEEVHRARNALVSRAPDLVNTGTFEVLLAHVDGGDHLILNVHHAAGDGMAALRLLRSIIRNYAGLADPVPDFDPVSARNVRKLVGARSIRERRIRAAAIARHFAVSTKIAARVAVENGTDDGGYGCHLIPITPEEVKQAASLRPPGATVNDLLLGALALTIRRWNDGHGRKPRRISTTMPVNVRPKEWSTEIFGNFASYVTVHIRSNEQADLEAATAAAHARTTRIKEHRSQGIIVDALKLRKFFPAGMKRVLNTKPIVGDRAVDTTWLTNLGRIDPLEEFGGDAGAVSELWFSAPGTMPMGATIGVITHGPEMFAALRYRHPQFDPAAAERFAELFRETLLGS